tara:strand:+ start:236 stop:448 length:213 start_codon:yes stop_codon:yes gene_type:complete
MKTPLAIIITGIIISISTIISTKMYVDSQPKYSFLDQGTALAKDGTVFVKCPSTQIWYRNSDNESFDKLP